MGILKQGAAAAAMGLIAASSTTSAWAEFPEKPITLVVT